MNLRAPAMRRAAALVLDAAAEVASQIDLEVVESPDHGSPWELACQALYRANEAWQAAQLAAPALKPRKRLRPVSRKQRRKQKATRGVWALVFERAGGKCESPGCVSAATELDHFRGRARSESVESCWALCFDCHRDKTDNAPSAAAWLEMFVAHCRKHGHREELRWALGRLTYVAARARLGEQLKASGARR